VRLALQRNAKTGSVREQICAAIVRPMPERTQRKIRAEDVQGVKYLRTLGPLLSGVRCCAVGGLHAVLIREDGGEGCPCHRAGVADQRSQDGGAQALPPAQAGPSERSPWMAILFGTAIA